MQPHALARPRHGGNRGPNERCEELLGVPRHGLRKVPQGPEESSAGYLSSAVNQSHVSLCHLSGPQGLEQGGGHQRPLGARWGACPLGLVINDICQYFFDGDSYT